MNALLRLCPGLVALLFAAQAALATGALFVRPLNSQETFRAMSIATYDANVQIDDQIAVSHVDQRFRNETNSRVEATFIFPLPDGAVITELFYWFNGVRYKASLREREEAQKQYADKVRRLIDPALLQYMGENVFKLNIAPIEPQSEVRFEITYAELLPYDFGAVTYRFLLKTTGLSPKPLERVSVRVDARTASSFRTLQAVSHPSGTATRVTKVDSSHYVVKFGDENFIPDRDLAVKYETARDGIEMNAITYTPTAADSFGVESFYALWLTPPDDLGTATLPRSIVFSADISSSMEGKRMDQLREALLAFLDGLEERDHFNIVVFGTNVVEFRADFVQATPSNVAEARAFVRALGAAGLTNIDGALRRSLAMSWPENSAKLLVFMTDGFPTWGELEVNAIVDSAAARNTGDARIFTFGIGEDISRMLIERLARSNGGYATFIASDDSIALVIGNYFRRVSHPVLTNIALDLGTLDAFDRYPTELPDLFFGTQVLQFGRYRNPGTHRLTMGGTYQNEEVTLSRATVFGGEGGNRAVARLWAKLKIEHLLAEISRVGEQKELVDAIVELSIRYGVLSPYTALYSDPTEDPPNPPPSTVDGADDIMVPLRPFIERAAPNPFADATVLVIHLPALARDVATTVAIYDATGELVCTLVDDRLSPGRHELRWNGRDDAGTPVPSGTYYCRVECGGMTAVHAMVLAR